MKEMETNIESLPDELWSNILVGFPADFLHDIARLVCPRWSRIIHSDVFTGTHIQQHPTYGLVLSLPSPSENEPPHSIYVTATQGGIETSELSCIHTKEIIATSCDGLALERNGHSLCVINPATKLSFHLPLVDRHDRHVCYPQSGIAYCAASKKYKVTLPYCNHRDQFACLDIVTVGVDRSWRHVDVPLIPEHIKIDFDFVAPVCSEGFLHWGRGRYCLTMNVETEIITMSEVPSLPNHQLYSFKYNYLSIGRYLTVLVRRKKNCWEVWEMKPGESGEWRKAMLPNIDLESHKCTDLRKCAFHGDSLHPVGWVKYPEVLALSLGRLARTCIFYNIETHEIDPVELPFDPNHSYRALVHRNSLIRLCQD